MNKTLHIFEATCAAFQKHHLAKNSVAFMLKV